MEEENKQIHIVCIGHTGTGRATLTEALKRLDELIIVDKNDNELDEFDKAGLHLTDEQKQKLRDLGINMEQIVSFNTDEELAEKMNEVIKSMELKPYEHHMPLTNSKPWKKKYFWE